MTPSRKSPSACLSISARRHYRRAFSVVAAAGVGKSHLVDEFRHWAERHAEHRAERKFVFQARALPQTHGQTCGLLCDLLAWRCARFIPSASTWRHSPSNRRSTGQTPARLQSTATVTWPVNCASTGVPSTLRSTAS